MWVLVPKHLRVAFLCSVSLVWQVVLSTITYAPQPPPQPAGPEVHSERLTRAFADEHRRRIVREDALRATAPDAAPLPVRL